jgi:hypothetical protein
MEAGTFGITDTVHLISDWNHHGRWMESCWIIAERNGLMMGRRGERRAIFSTFLRLSYANKTSRGRVSKASRRSEEASFAHEVRAIRGSTIQLHEQY